MGKKSARSRKCEFKHCRPFHRVGSDKELWLKFETTSNFTSTNLHIDYVIRNPCRKLFAHCTLISLLTLRTTTLWQYHQVDSPFFLTFDRVECLLCLDLYSSLFQWVFTCSTCFLQWTNRHRSVWVRSLPKSLAVFIIHMQDAHTHTQENFKQIVVNEWEERKKRRICNTLWQQMFPLNPNIQHLIW